MISSQKTLFCSNGSEHGRPKVTAVIESPQVGDLTEPWPYYSLIPIMGLQSPTKHRFSIYVFLNFVFIMSCEIQKWPKWKKSIKFMFFDIFENFLLL
jgi:hypothetical protein